MAIALYKTPLPADPVARQLHQHNYYQDCEALRVALDRGRHRVSILDTLGSDGVPYFIVCRGPAFIDDWHSAVVIRKELERLTREMVDGTFEIWRPAPAMSASRGRPEVVGRRPT
jgi:hypothetical protein